MLTNRTLVIAIIAVVVVLVSAGLSLRAVDRPGPAMDTAQADPVQSEPKSFASVDTYGPLLAEDRKVKPSVRAYNVKPDLSNVSNIGVFASALDAAQRKMIAKNGFVVSPTDYIQMFQVYENNEYQRPLKMPAFITTDSMLHTYHVFYDYSLREVESTSLFDSAVKLTDIMLAASQKDVGNAGGGLVRDAALRNVAFFAVARSLLVGAPPPSAVAAMAQADLEKITAHAGRAESSIIKGTLIDYSQFVPRGHYTRSEKLKKYFRAMMWYGLAPLALPGGERGPSPTLQALMMVRNLKGSAQAMSLWETVYEPTAFYVGAADDYTVYQYGHIIDGIYGRNPAVSDFADEKRLDAFIKQVLKLPGARIAGVAAGSDELAGRQFRFMGQRFIADSRILEKLTWEGRFFPMGLDVFAAMGSDRALGIVKEIDAASGSAVYQKQMAKMRREMADTSKATWQSNLYYGWLWSLQSLNKPVGEGYPSFMRSSAWLDKSLFTSLGSWTELRHDTILYAKQSASECGGGEEPIPIPKGYVEPNLEFWTKLKWLNQYTRDGLDGRGILSPELKDKFSALGDWIDFCRKITIKELTGQKVTEEEYEHIQMYGAELEQLFMDFAGGDIISDADKDMAVIADVHTAFGSVLEEGVGRAAEIFVVVPIEGKLYLTRGAVFTQYEFHHPASDRLTDEKWQTMLKQGAAPGLAEWTESFLVHKKKKPEHWFANPSGGC